MGQRAERAEAHKGSSAVKKKKCVFFFFFLWGEMLGYGALGQQSVICTHISMTHLTYTFVYLLYYFGTVSTS